MDKNDRDYCLQFVGLKEGKHHFEYDINNTFFDDFDYQEFEKSDVKADVFLIKKNTHLELDIQIEGIVNVSCDLTLENFDLPIQNTVSLVVKFGDHFEEVDEHLITIPSGSHELDIKQYIYECIVLAVPQKKIHPGVEDGTLDSEILDRLNEMSTDKEIKEKEDNIDPRWDKLKNLLKD
jgi:uncharacterized metal-binding protein YceD (DUF177 family)